MLVRTETADDHTLHRPWKLALVLHEFGCKFLIDHSLLRGRLTAALAASHSRRNDAFYLTVESLHLLLLGIKLLLVGIAVLPELLHDVVGLGLILSEAVEFLDSLGLHGLCLRLHLRQILLLVLKFLPCGTYLLRLILHLVRHVAEISEAAQSLTEVVTGQHIHVPFTGVPMLIDAHDKFGIMVSKVFYPLIYLVDFQLSKIDVIIQFPDLTVTFRHKFLSVCDLLSDEVQVGQHGIALGCILRQLTVDDGNLPLKPGLLLLLDLGILRRRSRAEAQEHTDRKYYLMVCPHLLSIC